jgi:cardiolipin synthase (CMP-forming)
VSDSATKPEFSGTPGSKIWTIPNILTLVRMACVPLIASLLLMPSNAARWWALGVYVVAGITDFFDGYLARKWKLQSSLGRMLDPIADKVLVAVILLVLCADQILAGGHIWAAMIIMAREVLVSGLREYLGGLSVSVPVTQIAKWKTTLQLVAIGFLIAGPAGESVVPGTTLAGIAGLWIAAAFTLYTGYDYMRAGLRHVVD